MRISIITISIITTSYTWVLGLMDPSSGARLGNRNHTEWEKINRLRVLLLLLLFWMEAPDDTHNLLNNVLVPVNSNKVGYPFFLVS